MGQPCTVCTHQNHHDINRAIVTGVPNRRLASQYGVSEISIRRHRKEHLPDLLIKAKEQEDITQAIDVIQQLKAINTVCWQILQEARRDDKPSRALFAVDRIERQITLQAELLHQIDRRPQVNVLVSGEWLAVRAAVIEALRPYPEAGRAVAERLIALEAGYEHR